MPHLCGQTPPTLDLQGTSHQVISGSHFVYFMELVNKQEQPILWKCHAPDNAKNLLRWVFKWRLFLKNRSGILMFKFFKFRWPWQPNFNKIYFKYNFGISYGIAFNLFPIHLFCFEIIMIAGKIYQMTKCKMLMM